MSNPKQSKKLRNRIRLVRRDIGDLLFHFTRSIEPQKITIPLDGGSIRTMNGSAYSVLEKILYEEKLAGTSRWSNGDNTICFTEAPIQEFNSIFSLVSIASSKSQHPRYEPYGVAVSKKWLFGKGGRPVIYDSKANFRHYSDSIRYRVVEYNPKTEVDYTWEREWRIKADELRLDPNHTLVILPTAEDAFNLVDDFTQTETDFDDQGPCGLYRVRKWLAVSLDIFGFSDSVQ